MINKRAWSVKVGKIFNTKPRDGSQKKSVWLPRLKAERRLSDMLSVEGSHVIIDGPTGTGKTSLAITTLNKEQIKFCLVQVVKNMDWRSFCRELSQPNNYDKGSLNTEFVVGIDKGLPTAKIKMNLGTEGSNLDDLELQNKTIENWTEHDICKLLQDEDITLMIDDFERSNDELVVRISDICKLLTQSYSSPNAKLVIVGTGDIFSKLYKSNESLDGRVRELSVGTLPTPEESWKFLQLGFEALDLTHPANDRYVDKNENQRCMQLIYTAADGLFKSLTEIGHEIAVNGHNRNRVSPKDIENATIHIPEANFKKFRRSFKEITNAIHNNPAIRTILETLYNEGICQIHHWDDLAFKLSELLSEDQCDNAIAQLIKLNFLVQTGQASDILYVDKPTLAHTMGVILSNPDKFPQAGQLLNQNCQMQLPFYNKKIFLK